MTSLFIAGLVFPALVGCSYTEATYYADQTEAFCAKQHECGYDIDLLPDYCAEEYGEGEYEEVGATCEFDPAEAKNCVRGIATLECDDATGFVDQSEVEACSEVWNCGDAE